MEGNCQANDAVYKCDVTRPLLEKSILRLQRENGRAVSITTNYHWNTRDIPVRPTLSSYMWHLKSLSSKTLNLKWSVLRSLPPYSNISNKCPLCLYEKLEIVTYQKQKELLNKRSELLCKCRHANKFLLKNYTGNDFR